jgi:hypothetical protein
MDLAKRMADLERRLAGSAASQPLDQHSTHHVEPSVAGSSNGTLGRTGAVEDSPIVHPTPRDPPTDGLAHFVFSEAAGSAYFGPSSNIALMRAISDAAARILEPLRQPGSVSRANSQSQQQAHRADFSPATTRPSAHFYRGVQYKKYVLSGKKL